MSIISIINNIKGGLIVSCQALEDEPLHGSKIMAAMAQAAKEGGAIGIRANSPEDIKAIRKQVDLPIIGLYKKKNYDSDIYITPTLKEVEQIIEAGADIIAIDSTNRIRPNNKTLKEFIKEIKENFNVIIMGDVSTFEEGLKAQEYGIDLVGTTLSGYTKYSSSDDGPDFKLLKKLVNNLNIPVILEGKVRKPSEVKKALKIGAWAVVVGTSITRPQIITKRFSQVIDN